jgi:outer membrane scaffolding protein for murein synthesis (MipA/OmpV family)
MKTVIRCSVLFLFIGFGLVGKSYASEMLPLWEAGGGLGVLTMADYRGSNEYRSYVLPIPYVNYRGEKFKIDRQSVRGLLFKGENMELDISFNASPPVDSQKNNARRGMPDLDPTFEVGPSFKFRLTDTDTKGYRSELILPVRSVLATDFSNIREIGHVFSPKIDFDWFETGPRNLWNVGFSVGAIFADRGFHRYYYSVDPAFATATRPAYSAKGGYSGSQITFSVTRRYEKWWLGAYARFDNMHGAVFVDSPLVKDRVNISLGIGAAWLFAKSKTVVKADE